MGPFLIYAQAVKITGLANDYQKYHVKRGLRNEDVNLPAGALAGPCPCCSVAGLLYADERIPKDDVHIVDAILWLL